MRALLPMVALLVVGCGDDMTPEQRAQRDAQDVAEVRANQVAPPDTFTPQKILYPDIEKHKLGAGGCAFAPKDGGMGAIAIAKADVGYMKRDGDIMIFAADKGSTEQVMGTWSSYDGRGFSFEIKLDPKTGKQPSSETNDFDASLTVTDGRDRVIYEADGYAQCGA